MSKCFTARKSAAFTSAVYHLSVAGSTSWYGFAKKIISIEESNPKSVLKIKKINGITSSEYPTPATRPENSVLSSMKLQGVFGIELPSWGKMLESCLEYTSESKLKN